MTIALVGIIGVQVYWFQNAIQLRQEQYDRAVNEALQEVNVRLSDQRMIEHYSKNIGGLQLDSLGNVFQITTDTEDLLDEIKVYAYSSGNDVRVDLQTIQDLDTDCIDELIPSVYICTPKIFPLSQNLGSLDF